MAIQHRPILLTLILAFLGVVNSFACTCDETTVRASVKEYDAIFSGRVISQTLLTSYRSRGILRSDTSKMEFNLIPFPVIAVKIKLEKIYKGKIVSDTLILHTADSGTRCGYYFKVGQKYIVYAKMYSLFEFNIYSTSHCSRTQPWNLPEVSEIIKETK